MTRLARFIVDHRNWILGLFAAVLIFSVIASGWVKVENDITFYLPEDAEARQGLTIMEEEFITYATAQVMIRDISADRAQAYADAISGLEGVALTQFSETRQHYRDDKALIDVTFTDTADSPISESALDAIKALLRDEDTIIYSEVGFSLSRLIAEQMLVVLIFVVIVVLAVLVFTSSTYAEIPVMVFTFMAAAVINIGTHFLLGTISFVSNSVGIVLQLALSVDYAIIFCNRYKEEHERLEIYDAVVKALAASIPEISASSLTTIAGLTAMTLMKFRLGADMGLTLIKSIVCSLLTVFLFMPCLLMLFGKAMDKTRHKRFVPKISAVGKLAYATRHVVPVLFVLLVIGAYLVFGHTRYAYSLDMVPAFRQTEMEAAQAEISESFGSSNPVAVLVPRGDYSSEQTFLRELETCPEVRSVTGLTNISVMDGVNLGDEVNVYSFMRIAGVDETAARALFAYYAAEQGEHRAVTEDMDAYRVALLDLFLFLHERLEAGDVELPEDQAAMVRDLYGQLEMVRDQLQSENHSRILLDLYLPVQSDETFAFLDQIHRIGERYYDGDVVLTGNSVSALGFRDSFASDNVVVGMMSLVLVMLILFFTFRSFGMPLLLILVIQGSIWMNFAIAALRGDYVFFLCYLIVSAIQMGANIDYAIVVSSRYREFRETMDRREAMIETLNLAFPTVITSGLMMVCSGLLIGFGVSQCIIAGMGYYVGTGTSISLILILFALPQVLLLGDHFVSATTLRAGHSAVLGFLSRNKLRFAGAFLAGAMLLAFVSAPLAVREAAELREESDRRVADLLDRTGRLRELAEELERRGTGLDELKYDFAEQLVTDEIGQQQLAEGEQTYNEFKAQYDSGLAEYNEGAARLEAAQAQYYDGASQLAEAQAQYDAGLAAYQEGLAQYEEGQRQLAEGQAQYDAGMAAYQEGLAQYEEGQQQLAEGQAQYDAGLAQYNQASAVMDAVAPLYYAGLALQSRVNELQAQYDDALASGDLVAAMVLQAELSAAQAALERGIGGMSISSLLAQYEDAQAQLAAAQQELEAGKAALDEGYAQAAAAEQQLAEAERQLAEGKAALDEGYAQAAAAEQQLAEGKQQLEEGKAALEAGYAQLHEGKAQIDEGKGQLSEAYQALTEGENELEAGRRELEEGREMLENNLEALNGSLSELDRYSDELERLQQGLRILREEKGVKDRLPRDPDALEILDTAENYYKQLQRLTESQSRTAWILAGLLLLAAALAGVGLLLSVVRKTNQQPGAYLAAMSALIGVVVFVLWHSRCAMLSGPLPLASAALAVTAAVWAELMFNQNRRNRTELRSDPE